MRGKKQRYVDFNNKFVAVRGKKNGLDQEDSDLEQNSVQPWVYLVGGKRAPNGFVGMRGKRPGKRKDCIRQDLFLYNAFVVPLQR